MQNQRFLLNSFGCYCWNINGDKFLVTTPEGEVIARVRYQFNQRTMTIGLCEASHPWEFTSSETFPISVSNDVVEFTALVIKTIHDMQSQTALEPAEVLSEFAHDGEPYFFVIDSHGEYMIHDENAKQVTPTTHGRDQYKKIQASNKFGECNASA